VEDIKTQRLLQLKIRQAEMAASNNQLLELLAGYRLHRRASRQ